MKVSWWCPDDIAEFADHLDDPPPGEVLFDDDLQCR